MCPWTTERDKQIYIYAFRWRELKKKDFLSPVPRRDLAPCLNGKESACNAGDSGSIPGWGRSLENGMATHSSILSWRMPMDRGTWWGTVLRVTKSWTQLKWLSTHTHTCIREIWVLVLILLTTSCVAQNKDHLVSTTSSYLLWIKGRSE